MRYKYGSPDFYVRLARCSIRLIPATARLHEELMAVKRKRCIKHRPVNRGGVIAAHTLSFIDYSTNAARLAALKYDTLYVSRKMRKRMTEPFMAMISEEVERAK